MKMRLYNSNVEILIKAILVAKNSGPAKRVSKLISSDRT